MNQAKNDRIVLLVGNPSADGSAVNVSSQLFAHLNGNGRETIHSQVVCGVPTYAFNQLWCMALNARVERRITHFLLWHADIRPLGADWLNVMFEEMRNNNADVLSAIVPIKDDKGVTSTAFDVDGIAAVRVTQKQAVHDFPETWTADNLLFNDGLMLVDFRKPWVEQVCFTINDRITLGRDGKYKATMESEDWNFSRQCHRLGLRVFVTRKIVTEHYGIKAYRSDEVWGATTDPESRLPEQAFEVLTEP